MTQRYFEVDPPITKIIASGKRIDQGVHPPARLAGNKIHLYEVLFLCLNCLMQKKISLLELFLTFVKIGLILIGGGYVILPILQSEMVEKKSWITEDELVEFYALSQSLSGFIAINISIFIGYKLRGKSGAVVSVLGLIFFAFWIIVGLASILSTLTTNTYVQGAFWGVEIAVIILILSSLREMWTKAMISKFSYIVYLFACSLMIFTKLSPALVILITVVVGLLYKILNRKKEEVTDER